MCVVVAGRFYRHWDRIHTKMWSKAWKRGDKTLALLLSQKEYQPVKMSFLQLFT